MAMYRVFICDERKDCTNTSCKNGGLCRFTTDSAHAAPEMRIEFDGTEYMRYWIGTEKEFTE